MKRVIVTGATGFVGSNLVMRLLEEGHRVSAIVRDGSDLWRLNQIRADVNIISACLTDKLAVKQAIEMAKPDWVFHLAVCGAYSWQTDLSSIIATNVVGTTNLLESCLQTGFESFVNTGSSSEYGFKDHAPHEGESVEPNSYYSVSKVSATLLCRYFAQKHNVHVPTLRLYSVYGPFEDPRRLLPTLIVSGLDGKLPPLVDPDIARDYVYIDDVVNAYLLAAGKNTAELGAIYNVGSGVQTSLREIVEVARDVLGIAGEPKWGSMPNRSWDSNCWVSDNRKLVSQLGWNARYSLADGFSRMVNWFRSRPGVIRHYKHCQLAECTPSPT